ncbi:MerC domain-containing protein [Stakelama saccharophila]|uniref:MerC domain-containing protein n=1 Tax=Stakelama saccharophila TaxID=3075605 RepID=A0ABZ0B763_9SPHN|nr:MerC domain-containing protein [Stakelama sp. W311]WNO53234.1 MerC domain-containing protein [Stakelama sp. W311]
MTSDAPLVRFWRRIEPRFDNAAIALSGLCLVHCVASVVLLAVLASAGALLDPRIHEIGLLLAIALGAVALGRGVVAHGRWQPLLLGACGLVLMALALSMPHGAPEAALTMVGVCCLAVGHVLNRRARQG